MLTRRELASLLGVHMQTVTKWEREGMPIAERGRRGKASLYSEVAVRAWIAAREEAAQNGSRLDVTQERARKERAQAQLAEQKYQQLAGELLPKEDVAKVWAAEIAGARSVLLAVPTTYADRAYRAATLHGVGAVEEVLRDAIHEVLRELADPERATPRPRSSAARKK